MAAILTIYTYPSERLTVKRAEAQRRKSLRRRQTRHMDSGEMTNMTMLNSSPDSTNTASGGSWEREALNRSTSEESGLTTLSQAQTIAPTPGPIEQKPTKISNTRVSRKAVGSSLATSTRRGSTQAIPQATSQVYYMPAPQQIPDEPAPQPASPNSSHQYSPPPASSYQAQQPSPAVSPKPASPAPIRPFCLLQNGQKVWLDGSAIPMHSEPSSSTTPGLGQAEVRPSLPLRADQFSRFPTTQQQFQPPSGQAHPQDSQLFQNPHQVSVQFQPLQFHSSSQAGAHGFPPSQTLQDNYSAASAQQSSMRHGGRGSTSTQNIIGSSSPQPQYQPKSPLRQQSKGYTSPSPGVAPTVQDSPGIHLQHSSTGLPRQLFTDSIGPLPHGLDTFSPYQPEHQPTALRQPSAGLVSRVPVAIQSVNDNAHSGGKSPAPVATNAQNTTTYSPSPAHRQATAPLRELAPPGLTGTAPQIAAQPVVENGGEHSVLNVSIPSSSLSFSVGSPVVLEPTVAAVDSPDIPVLSETVVMSPGPVPVSPPTPTSLQNPDMLVISEPVVVSDATPDSLATPMENGDVTVAKQD